MSYSISCLLVVTHSTVMVGRVQISSMTFHLKKHTCILHFGDINSSNAPILCFLDGFDTMA